MGKSFLRFSLVALLSLSSAAVCRADDQKDQKDSARYMLRNEAPQTSAPSQSEKTADDFKWEALTKNGPASGAKPTIGEGSGKAYYEFADGRPHPYYIVPPTK